MLKLTLTGRRAFLFGLGTLAGAFAFAIAGKFRHSNEQIQALDDQKRNFTVVGEASLRDRAAAKGLIYGAAIKHHILAADADFATCFAKECGILVPEGEFSWRFLRPSPDRFKFAPADSMVKFARTHGMLFRGGSFVWHKSLPQWFTDKVNSQNAEQILTDHIKTVAGHYAGKMHSWDVVNEAIQLSDQRADGLRKSPWLKLLGSGYIDLAFRSLSTVTLLASKSSECNRFSLYTNNACGSASAAARKARSI